MTKVAKADNYANITNAFIEALESCLKGESQIPGWVRPWSLVGSPRNGFTGRLYQGMNSIILAFKAGARGYEDNRWATYNQIMAAGGQVNKGEKGTQVVMWKFLQDKKDPSNTIPFLRVFTVFNVNSQSTLTLPSVSVANQDERIETAEQMFKATGACLIHGGDKAYFDINNDAIHMPIFEKFKSAGDYYATLAHELIHWTGHKSRLNRPLNEGRFGKEAYAFEELVAELGASFVCQDLGIDGYFQDNHVAYIKSWIKVLQNDTKAIFRASSLAKVASKTILGETEETHEDETEDVIS
jgi:antirestriction protein ArdC